MCIRDKGSRRPAICSGCGGWSASMATLKPVGLDRTWSVAVVAVAVDEVLGLLGDFGVVRVHRQVVMRRVQGNPVRCALALKAATVLDQVTEVLRLDVRRHVVNGVHGSSSQLSVHCLLYTSDAADEEASVDLGG